jgi:hypothetical protein
VGSKLRRETGVFDPCWKSPTEPISHLERTLDMKGFDTRP